MQNPQSSEKKSYKILWSTEGSVTQISLTLIRSLKITWLRRIIKENEGWSIFPNFLNIHKIFLFGDSYFDTIIKRCKNIFWTDVVYACKSLYDNMWTPNISRNIDMPIWYNSRLCNHFKKEWFNKRLIFVKDLFLNRNFVSLDYLRTTLFFRVWIHQTKNLYVRYSL